MSLLFAFALSEVRVRECEGEDEDEGSPPGGAGRVEKKETPNIGRKKGDTDKGGQSDREHTGTLRGAVINSLRLYLRIVAYICALRIVAYTDMHLQN